MIVYRSIRGDVLTKLSENLPEIQERFGIATIAVFGSVSREESTLANLISLGDYLEDLLGRKVDLVAARVLSPYIRDDVIAEPVYV